MVPLFKTDDDVIVEWRAATVGFLDDLLEEVNAILGLFGSERLSLAQMLEAGTWKVCSPSFDCTLHPTDWLYLPRAAANLPKYLDQIPKNLQL